jgi:Protein of unknown function (DUF1648)
VSTPDVRRRLSIASIPVSAAVVATIALLGWRTTLPDPLASHFSAAGRPDGSMSRNVFCWVMVNVAVLVAIVGAMASLRTFGRGIVTTWASATSFIAWLIAGVSVWTVVTQHDIARWSDARDPRAIGLIAVVGVAALAAALASRLALSLPAPASTVAPTARLGIGADERATWTQTLTSPWPLVVAFGGAAIAVDGLIAGQGVLAVTGAVLAIVGVEVHAIRVTVDRRGLAISWGPLGIPRTHIAIDRIASAAAIDIRPTEWGGWGYRGSLRLFGKAAAVLRRGPGIRVDLVDGRTFAVTVDHADVGAGLLNDLVAHDPTRRT